VAESPTQRALAECRRKDWPVQVVERWNQWGNGGVGVRIDLFGGIDLVAITPEGILGIQATSGSNHSARVKKLKALRDLEEWVDCGAILEVWSWTPKKVLNRDGSTSKRKRYELRIQRLTTLEFD
jgi:hypothetical protein